MTTACSKAAARQEGRELIGHSEGRMACWRHAELLTWRCLVSLLGNGFRQSMGEMGAWMGSRDSRSDLGDETLDLTRTWCFELSTLVCGGYSFGFTAPVTTRARLLCRARKAARTSII